MVKIKLIKIDFDSEMVKLMSERINILSQAIGGIGYLDFNIQGLNKAITVILGWLVLQYISFALLKVSKTIKKEEDQNDGTN